MEKEYNPTIDTIKGILILFVILGHLLPGGLNSSFLRYSIYSFHMPLFLFISGYLFHLEKSAQMGVKELVKKYWKRMLLEWFLAWLAYTSIVLYGNYSFHNVMVKIVYPFYHLWYVPGLFAMIFILVITFQKLRDNYLSFVFLIGLTFILTSLCLYKSIFNPYHISFYTVFLMGTLGQNINIDNKKIRIALGGGKFNYFLRISGFNMVLC